MIWNRWSSLRSTPPPSSTPASVSFKIYVSLKLGELRIYGSYRITYAAMRGMWGSAFLPGPGRGSEEMGPRHPAAWEHRIDKWAAWLEAVNSNGQPSSRPDHLVALSP